MFGERNEIEISITDIRSLANSINKNYDVDLSDYATTSLKRRIQRILKLDKFDSVATLIARIEEDDDFFHYFLKEITVNVTEMFRDPSFWIDYRDVILKELANKPSINIWHAGCSSGEEVFSNAIVLKEAGLFDKVKIFATDLNDDVINTAKSGNYSQRKMKINRENYKRFGGKYDLNHYLRETEDSVFMDKELLSNTIFLKNDLVKDSMLAKFNIIFCRNVLIYFNANLQNKVISKYHNALVDKGYLILGAKESLIWCDDSDKFSVVNDREKIFQKIKD